MKKVKFVVMVFLFLLFSMALAPVRPARADGGALIWYWLLGQIFNDIRQEPVERHSIGFNPSANVFDPIGNFVGSIADLRDTVSAVGLGAVVKISSGATSTGIIMGHRLVCDEEDFPYAIGIYREDLDKIAKNGKEVRERDLTKGTIKSVPADCNKWSIVIDTAMFSHRMYSCKLRTYYIDVEPRGFLRLGRKAVIRYQETVFKFLVRDAKYLAKAVNNPQIQCELMMSVGLVGGSGQLAKPAYEIKPEVMDEVARPYTPDGSLLPVTPNPSKVEKVEKTEITTTTGAPQATPPVIEHPKSEVSLPQPTVESEQVKTQVPREVAKETQKGSAVANNGSAATSTSNSSQIVIKNTASGDNSNAQVTVTNSGDNTATVQSNISPVPVVTEDKYGIVLVLLPDGGCIDVLEVYNNLQITTRMHLSCSGLILNWRELSTDKRGTLIYQNPTNKGKIWFKSKVGTVIRIRLQGTNYWTTPKTVGEDITDGEPSLQYNFRKGR